MFSINIIIQLLVFFIVVTVVSFQFPSSIGSALWKLLMPNQIKIIGGRAAHPGEFPYQVVIKASEKNISYICGGSIITEYNILTAAHCVDNVDYILIQVGSTSLKYQSGLPVFLVTPKNIKVHHNYDKYYLKNDIALITLMRKIPYNAAFIRPVLLPKLSQSDPSTFDNYEAKVSGWGKIHDSDAKGQTYLQTSDVYVMPYWQCKLYYAIMYYDLNDAQICTLYIKSGTCNGDSGGGLIIEKDGKQIVIGIVSFGTGLCESGSPGVYTNVAAYLPWIYQHIMTGI